MNDHELLQRYAESRCEASFAELVRRYVDLVYSAALRQTGGDAHLAHDVTQSVFIDLARKASSLSERPALSGWLYTSAHFAAAKIVRTEQRWRAREHQANSMREISEEPASDARWEEVRPVIDEAMHELSQSERDAVLLRYFEKRQLGEVGAKLGISEDAARKRVDRALEKLRGRLARRGVTSTSTALILILGAHTVTAAPAGLGATIAGAAMAGTAAGTGTTLTLFKLMAMSKLKMGILGAVVAAGVATPLIIQHQSQAKLRAENEALRHQTVQLTDQVTPLLTENARFSNLLAQAAEARSVEQSQSNELLRLRGEVARLRQDAGPSARVKGTGADSDDPAMQAVMETLAARVSKLRHTLEQRPNYKIPEIKVLSDKDWLSVAGDIESLESDEEISKAMSELRGRAKSAFGSKMRDALRRYAEANGDMLPGDITQLQPYLEQPVDAAALQRYQIAESGKLADLGRNKILIKEIAPRVDEDYDSHFEFSLNGTTSHSDSRVGEALEKAAEAYAVANGGLLPKTPEQVAGYLQQQVDPGRVERFLNTIPSSVTTLDQLKGKR